MSKAKAAKPGAADFSFDDDGSQRPEVGNGHVAAIKISNSEPIIVPLGSRPIGANDRPLHVDLMLSRDQSNALRRALIGLRSVDAKCKTQNGLRLVVTNQDVVRWLLEQVS